MTMPSGHFWFCLTHHTVEPDDGCGPADRLGPYPTHDEAAQALDKVRERNEAWDNDPEWKDLPPYLQTPGSGSAE
jgi:hypothetical protein